MKWVGYEQDGQRQVGVLVTDDEIVPVDGAADLVALIEQGATSPDLDGTRVKLADVTLTAPVPLPRRNVFCVGRNYDEHAREFANSGYDATASDSHLPDAPVVFTKAPQTVIGPGAQIDPQTDVTSELDYEAELGVIIGKGGRGISRDEALEHVFGYTIINDVTARDLQKTHKQWFLGKSLDTFCPMGPWVVTADEVGDESLEFVCTVNGEVRQQASTADLIFDVPAIIETISRGITLLPGDVIATGTPKGVGIGFDPPRFLQPGDVVEIMITRLGTLTNEVGPA